MDEAVCMVPGPLSWNKIQILSHHLKLKYWPNTVEASMTNDQRRPLDTCYYGPLISEALIFIFISCAKYNRSYNFTGYNSHIQNLSNHIKSRLVPHHMFTCLAFWGFSAHCDHDLWLYKDDFAQQSQNKHNMDTEHALQ